MAGREAEVKECWYSILGVERIASPEVIRSAYRKEALKWHPDKIQQSGASPKDCQEATARFQNIVQAYEVLSDPVERAWYDKHRSEILASGSASKDFEFNVFPYFSPSVFSGFGDSGKGFYKVYSNVFVNIHKKEQAFAKAYGMGPIGEAPQIGNSASPIAEVEEFYKYWTGFSSVKDFSWCDRYQVSSASNRKERRLMEEDNAKNRKRERREFNDAVRELCTFVKKRDKRWLDRQVELNRLQKEKEEQLKLRKQKLQQEKLAKALAFKEQDWTKISDDIQYDAIEDVNEGSYAWKSSSKKNTVEEESQEFYCIVCSKRFRSQKQWENHEKSKKHIERAAALKQSFLDEDESLLASVLNSQRLENECNSDGRIGRENQEAEASATEEESPQIGSADENSLGFNRERSIGGGKSKEEEYGCATEQHDHLKESSSTLEMGKVKNKTSDAEVEDAQAGMSLSSEESKNFYMDDDEDGILVSMLNSRRSQSQFPSDRRIDRENQESEESAKEDESPQISSEDEKSFASHPRRSNGRRKSKAEKQYSSAGERHDDLLKELSSSLERVEVVQNITLDLRIEDLQAGTGLSVEDSESCQPLVNGKKKKMQRGQKKGKFEVSGKPVMQDASPVTESHNKVNIWERKATLRARRARDQQKQPLIHVIHVVKTLTPGASCSATSLLLIMRH